MQVVVFVVRVTVFVCMIAFAFEYIVKYDENSVLDDDAPKPASLSDLHLVDMR